MPSGTLPGLCRAPHLSPRSCQPSVSPSPSLPHGTDGASARGVPLSNALTSQKSQAQGSSARQGAEQPPCTWASPRGAGRAQPGAVGEFISSAASQALWFVRAQLSCRHVRVCFQLLGFGGRVCLFFFYIYTFFFFFLTALFLSRSARLRCAVFAKAQIQNILGKAAGGEMWCRFPRLRTGFRWAPSSSAASHAAGARSSPRPRTEDRGEA